MKHIKETSVGRAEQKGDVIIHLVGKKSGGLSISLKSSVEAMFGTSIRKSIEDTLGALGVEHAGLEAKDRGALEYVIMARVEAAARKLYEVTEPGFLPERKTKPAAPERRRLRRTRLYLPGNNPDLIVNAGLFGADCIILDLEDSVAPAEKDAARVLVRNVLISVDFGGAERIVRVNPLSTEYGRRDIEMIVPAEPSTLLIPKCDDASDVRKVEEIVAAVEKEHGVKSPILLMPLIETARGVVNAYGIASASGRVCALCFGAEDFTADMGVARTKAGTESFTARSLIVLAARAAGIQAIDTVFSDVRDTEGLIESTKEAMALGYEGKGVIHPSQIEPIHEVFTPAPEQIEHARKVVTAIEEARRMGSGVATIGSKMIDAPIEARARKVLDLAERLGLEGGVAGEE